MREKIIIISLFTTLTLPAAQVQAEPTLQKTPRTHQLSTTSLGHILKISAETATRKQQALDAKYLTALQRLKKSYKREGRFEDAFATVNELHSVSSGEGEKATAIPPSSRSLLKARQTYERERRNIQDFADVSHIKAVERHISELKKQAVRLPDPEKKKSLLSSINRLQEDKAYKAAKSRHLAYVALKIESSRASDRSSTTSRSSLTSSR